MIDGLHAYRMLTAAALAAGACAGGSAPAKPVPTINPPAATQPSAAAPSGEAKSVHMKNEPVKISENTVETLSNHRIGVSNIWQRDLPDEHGTMASRMSANVAILDEATKAERSVKVHAGSVIALGSERWSVVEVKESNQSTRGWISLRRAGH